jgi:putative ABC transport system substrate-binding protein
MVKARKSLSLEKGDDMRKGYLAVVLLSAVLLISACGKQETKGLYHIGIVQIVEAELLDDARRGVMDGLRDEGFVDGKNIRISFKSAQGDLSNISIIIKALVSSNVSMIITNSTPCMVSAAQIVRDIPVVFTVAFSPEQLQMKDPPKNLTGVSDPSSMSDLIQLIKTCMPGIQRLGIPYNPSEQNAVLAAENIRVECRKNGIELVEMNVFSSNEVLQNVRALAQKNIQAMVVSADNTLATGIASVVKICNERKIPLFVTEPNEVERGACAGIGADFYEWGKQSGKVAAQIIRGKKTQDIPIQNLLSNKLYINLSAAKTQGVKFPEELVRKASKIIE